MSAESLRIAPLAGWAALLIVGCVVGVLLDRSSAVPILSAILCVPFLFVAQLRCAALVHVLKEHSSEPPVTSAVDASCLPEVLPRYAILVPLYKEAEIIGQLIEGLRALDYPANRLQISQIVEVDDASTRAAIARQVLPATARVVVVPRGNPRTKPRALNHALANAIGDYVVVYDAEVLPNPGQLREALAVLIGDPENTGCVQAHLNIYNVEHNAITRQFAIEYNALFGAILPTLGRFGLPITAGRNLKPLPEAHFGTGGRLGCSQCHRGRRPGDPACPARLQCARYLIDDVGGSAGIAARMDWSADALVEGLDADVSGTHASSP